MEPTRGAVTRLMAGREQPSAFFQPLLEVRDVRRLGNDPSDDRYCVQVTDGEYVMKIVFGSGSTPMQQQVNAGGLQLHVLLRLIEWNLVEVPNKKGGRPQEVLTVHKSEAVGTTPPDRRVPPEALGKWAGTSSHPAYTQASQAAPQAAAGFGMQQPAEMQSMGMSRPAEQGSAYGLAPAAAPAPWQQKQPDQRQPPSAAWGPLGGEETQDQSIFGGAPAPAPVGQNPYSAGVGVAAAPPGGQAYGFTSLSGAPPDNNMRPAPDAGNPYSAAGNGAAARGTSEAPMGGAYGLTAQGAPQTAPAASSVPSPYAAPAGAPGAGGAASAVAPGVRQYSPPLTSFGFGGNQPQQQPQQPQQGSFGYGGAVPPAAPGGAPQQPVGFSGAQQPQQQQPPGFGSMQPPGFGSMQPPGFGGARGVSGPYSPGAAGRGAATAKAGTVMPISALSPYTNGKWTIKARITQKGDIRKFNNPKGEGQLFKIELVDKTGAEIAGTFFGRAVDRFYEMLRPQQVYYFSRGSVKMANKRYDKGEFVITFDENTSIEAAEEDQEIPGVNYTFVPLAEVDRLEVGSLIDVKAVIFEARDPFTVTLRRSNEEKVKRELVLWDDSGVDGSTFIEMTIWGQNAHDNFEVGSVILAKGMRVSEWNGAKSMNGSSGYELNPDNQLAFALRRKFEEKRPQGGAGAARAAKMQSGVRETIEEIREADLALGPPQVPGQGFDPSGPKSIHRHFCLATLTSIPTERPPYYQACPAQVEREQKGKDGQMKTEMRQCNRKVTQNGGIWQCQSGHTCERPVHRYLCNRVQVVDQTGSFEVSFFDEAGRTIFGCEADDIAVLWDDPTRDAELQQKLSQINWKRYLFRLSSKKEMWQDELRVRVNAEEGKTPDFIKEGQRLLSEVKEALAAPAPAQDALVPGR